MDVRALDFDDDSFDVAIDKGTMDAMMTAKGDIWVKPSGSSLPDCGLNFELCRILPNRLSTTVTRRLRK